MTSARIDNQLRKFGYFLVRRHDVNGTYWFVGKQGTSNGWNCANLDEARSLLTALREQVNNGGTIIHDGDGWVCC